MTNLPRRTFLRLSSSAVLAAAALPVGRGFTSVLATGHSRAPDADAPRRLRRADSFLGIHFDFHADDDSVNIGGRTTRAMIASVIDQVHPDYIQVDCKGHRGLSSYPTRVGNPAPSFVGDQLRLWREVTAERGVSLYLHYSGISDAEAVRRHPDWAVLNADGSRDDHITSPFGPYADRLLIPQLEELIDVYGVDGVWIDGECWAVKHDYSPVVVDRFRATTGITDVPKKPDDPHWFEWTEFNRQGFRDYVRHYADALHTHAPTFQLTSNWAFSDHMPEPATLPLDFLSGDFALNNSVNSARFAGRCLAGQGTPWDLMAWSFGGRYEEGAWTQKSVLQLQREAAVVLALGGGFQAYFRQLRDAAIRTWQIPLMHEVAAFARARQPFCHKARAVPQIGLIYAGSAYYRMNPRLFAPYGGELTAIHGILQNLLDSQQAVEVSMEHQLRGRMSEYPLLVYPEWPTADEAFRLELLDYVRRGGSLLVVGPKAGHLFDDVSRVSGAEPVVEGIRWLEHDGQLAALKTPSARVIAGPGVEHFGGLHDRDDITTSSSPAATITPVGRGQLAIVWLNLGERYVNGRTLVAKDFLAALVRTLFPAPIVTVSGSHLIDVTVTQLDGRLHVHLVNTSGPHEDKNVYAFEEIPAVGPIEIELRLPEPPSRVTRQPAGLEVPFETKGGVIRLVVPSLAIHEVLVMESA
jgi:hypothetical protein